MPPAARPPLSLRHAAFAVAAIAAALLSAALAWRAVSLVADARAMQAWPVVAATLTSANLETGARRGSARAVATYTYVVDGQPYAGSRVSLYNGDSIGDFQQRTHDDLQAHLARHESVPVHVDPADPRRAILRPVLRWEILALDLLAAVGAAVAAWMSARQALRPPALAAPALPGAASRATAAWRGDAGTAPRLASREAWRRRLIALGVALAAMDFGLTDISGPRSSTVLERWIADEVVSGAEVRAESVPAGRLEAGIAAAGRAAGVEPVVTRLDAVARGAGYRVQVVVGRAEAASAPTRLDALLTGLGAQFGSPPPIDLFISPPTPPLPYLTAGVEARASAVARGLVVAAVVLVAVGLWL